MDKNYLINGKEVSLYINNIAKIASWWHPKKEIWVDYKIAKDNNDREFIVMKGLTIYLDENKVLTIEECKRLAEERELNRDEFVNAVLKVGVDQLKLEMPCRKIEGYFCGIIKNLSEKEYRKVCVLDESSCLRKLEDNYKVNIRCLDPEYECIIDDWYVSDLVSFINSGYVKIL